MDLLKRPAGEYRENTFQKLEEKIKTLSAERIYQYLEEADLDYDAWERLEREFYKDDHVFWKVIDREDAPGEEGEGDGDGAPLPMPEDFSPDDSSSQDSNPYEDTSAQSGTSPEGEGKEEKNQEAGNQEPENRGAENQGAENQESENRGAENQKSKSQESQSSGEGKHGEGNSGEDSQGEDTQEDSQSGNSSGKKQEERKKAENRKPTGQEQREEQEAKQKRDELSKEWEDISKRTEQEIEHSSKEKQEEQGSLAWFLRLEQKKYTDFRDFLRRLSVDREEMEVDLDSFDYGYYYYGLEQYGNMPLIEENEYREGRKLQELVIAIDTSHSTKGEMVKGFLEETAGILKQKDAFFQKVKVHILECDDELRKDICLENVEDLEQYSKNFAVKGGYGTDFRPVFRYVSDLQKRGELKNLKGLMYFTDGKGRYPKEAPPYVTAFVFPKGEDIDDDNVPFWAMKLYQREKD